MSNDLSIKTLSLLQVVQLLHTGEHGLLVEAGIGLDVLEQLRALPMQDLCTLVEQADLQVTVHIDPSSLKRCLERLADLRESRLQLEQFVRRGASPELLARLYSMPQRHVLTLRRVLGVDVPVGRPALPPLDIALSIEEDWARIRTETDDPRQQYLALLERYPAYSLTALTAVIDSSTKKGNNKRFPQAPGVAAPVPVRPRTRQLEP
ncbi:STY4526/YPO1902 family pathogenicity island replication protein [Chitinimonas koreensis]|uniref:STY4526/YPO1902 family pathogenicity island replication protein n=1 Tax=Chitinimonas koreensis TaxID=356302 RepID=UPI000490920C|nr:STY4526/YPO1902 family pathogenicity island replication protein [Chitinimonas koreensis]QNM95461.1 DUF2857 family protein [Chitinimonas koreensis]